MIVLRKMKEDEVIGVMERIEKVEEEARVKKRKCLKGEEKGGMRKRSRQDLGTKEK